MFSLISSPYTTSGITTAWKLSKYGVISGPHFPVFVFSPNTGKYGPEITPYLNTLRKSHLHTKNPHNSKHFAQFRHFHG